MLFTQKCQNHYCIVSQPKTIINRLTLFDFPGPPAGGNLDSNWDKTEQVCTWIQLWLSFLSLWKKQRIDSICFRNTSRRAVQMDQKNGRDWLRSNGIPIAALLYQLSALGIWTASIMVPFNKDRIISPDESYCGRESVLGLKTLSGVSAKQHPILY